MNYVVKKEGMGPVGILWVLFIALKLIAVVDWSWLTVIFWPVALWASAVLIICGIGVTMWLFSGAQRAKLC